VRSQIATALRRVPPAAAAALLGFVALVGWGLSSPVGSSPDDDFHLASIWCGLGERDGLCGPGTGDTSREVNRDLVVTSVCYAYDPEKSAGCQGDGFGEDPATRVVTERGNFAGLYPPVFYAVTSLFASQNLDVSTILVRGFNALLFIGLVGATYALLPRHRRNALIASAALTVVPLGMFLIPSTNPSSWAIASSATLWISLLGYFESTGPRKWGLAGIAALSTVIGAGARADAAIYSVVAIGVACFLAFRADKRFWRDTLLAVGLVVVAVAFYLGASQSGAATTGLTGTTPTSAAQWIGLFIANIVNVPDLWVGVFGHWGLGWLDTAMPAAVWVGSFGVVVAVIASQLRSRDRRGVIAILGLVALLFVFPAYILTQSQALVGGYVQPRYIMPLIIILVGVAVLSGPRSGALADRRVLGVGAAILALANCAALYINIRRYVTGLDTLSLNLDAQAEWWWSAGPSPLAVWIIGSLAFAGCVAFLIRVVSTSQTQARRSISDLESAEARGSG